MRVLCLLDNEVKPGDRWMWNDLPDKNDEVDFLWVTPADLFPKWGKLITYYPTYFWLAIKALMQVSRKPYDLVLAWEGKNGFPFAFLRSLLGRRRPKFVILGYNHRGIIAHFPGLTRFALKSVDRLVVFSKWEASHLHEQLGIPKEKVVFSLHGYYDVDKACTSDTAESADSPRDDFIFSPGRSYRDYATLARAVEGLPVRVVINARPFNIRGISFPSNVVINDLVPTREFYDLLKQARFVVVPLMSIQHSGGDSVILQAMAARKAVIATRSPSSETYIDDGITGLLVPPGDAGKLREAINFLLDHPSEAVQMGERARQIYEDRHTPQAIARDRYMILEQVCRE